MEGCDAFLRPIRLRWLPWPNPGPSCDASGPVAGMVLLLNLSLALSAGLVMLVLSYLGVSSSEKKPRKRAARILGVLGVLLIAVQAWQAVTSQARLDTALAELGKNTTKPVPVLKVAESLDLEKEEKVFRLPITNEGDPISVDMAIVWLKGGEQVHDKFMPMKLGTVFVSRKDAPVMMRVIFVDKNARPPILWVNPARPRHMAIYSSNKRRQVLPASFCVRISAIGADASEDRAFQLVPDRTQAVLYRPTFLGRSCS
jgi:hypothetical protein